MGEKARIRFGAFSLDDGRRELLRDGVPVPLSSRGFDLLRALLRAPDRVVSRGELLRSAWPDTAVDEHNLSVQMSKLRQALGENVIVTVPGRGYQFVAPLLTPDRPAALPPPAAVVPFPAPRRRRVAILAVAVPALGGLAAAAALLPVLRPREPPPLSIAVMPLRDLSGAPTDRYLADAITDDLTTDLAHLPGSVVIARETAESYSRRAIPADRIGRALRVRYLLEGSLRAENAALHINAQLVDAATGAHVWSERFDLPRARLGEARDLIVGRLAGALDVALVGDAAERADRDRPDDPDALDLFFRARSILDHDDSLDAFDRATALLRRAVAARPDFADGDAVLGEALLRKIASTDDPREPQDRAEADRAIAHALALSPRNPAALAARAHAEFAADRFADAAYTARAALAIDPNHVGARDVLAASALGLGRLDEAADATESILRLDPEGASSRQRALRLGTLRLLQHRLGEAEDWLRRSIAGDPDPRPGQGDWDRAEGARMLLVAAAELDDRHAEAVRRFAAYDAVWPHRTAWRVAATAPRAIAALSGFAAMLAALRAAGMPDHADEHADDGVPADAAPLPDGSFVPTPTRLPGARTVDTDALFRLLRGAAPPPVLDVGSGAAVIADATWCRPDAVPGDRALDAALPRSDPAAAVVVTGDGTYGSAGYDAALRLVRSGRTGVIWYRGGEEAWAAKRLPASDRRQ
ncbi:MAG: winged helix-turn-helix domain-containing protein [Gluconacetobacter diazotrophicus]|nr:winged helix-turn-helix domain-containing protein [Gluconacetobacter diazotrophicus]